MSAKQTYLDAGVRLLGHGVHYVTARRIAASIISDKPVRHSGIVYHWRTTSDLLDAVALEAIRTDNKMAVARLIADGHSSVAGWSVSKRRAYLAELA